MLLAALLLPLALARPVPTSNAIEPAPVFELERDLDWFADVGSLERSSENKGCTVCNVRVL